MQCTRGKKSIPATPFPSPPARSICWRMSASNSGTDMAGEAVTEAKGGGVGGGGVADEFIVAPNPGDPALSAPVSGIDHTGARVETVAHAGHLAPMEQPAAVAAALQAWVEGSA